MKIVNAVIKEKGINMKTVNGVALSLIAIVIVLFTSPATPAQHKHGQSGQKQASMMGMKSEMAKMMQSPHHKLMMAYMKSMADFATTLRDQAVKPGSLDAEFARGTVSELRHNLDAMDALHQKHMQSMSAEMQSKMQMMMEKMDKNRSMLKDQVSALEADVQPDKPDAKQVVTHANALLKHLGMMKKMGVQSLSYILAYIELACAGPSMQMATSKRSNLNETNKTGLIIAFVLVLVLFLLFGGGMMTGSMMSGGMMGHGWIGGFSWMWIPTLITLGLGVLLGWAIFGRK